MEEFLIAGDVYCAREVSTADYAMASLDVANTQRCVFLFTDADQAERFQDEKYEAVNLGRYDRLIEFLEAVQREVVTGRNTPAMGAWFHVCMRWKNITCTVVLTTLRAIRRSRNICGNVSD